MYVSLSKSVIHQNDVIISDACESKFWNFQSVWSCPASTNNWQTSLMAVWRHPKWRPPSSCCCKNCDTGHALYFEVSFHIHIILNGSRQPPFWILVKRRFWSHDLFPGSILYICWKNWRIPYIIGKLIFPKSKMADGGWCHLIFAKKWFWPRFLRVTIHKTKKSQTFPDESAGNMSNKCTFMNLNSPWTSRMKNELQYE